MEGAAAERDYARVERALRLLHARGGLQGSAPSLAELARSAELSPGHLQRVFLRWAGVSPQQFLSYLSLDHAKKALQEGQSVLQASFAAGLSGPGRLHDLFVRLEALSPGEYKRQGEGLRFGVGTHPTPFGRCVLASGERGLVGMGFFDGEDGASQGRADLQARWPRARFVEDSMGTAQLVEQIFDSPQPGAKRPRAPLRLWVRGTPFRVQVWEALLRVPAGTRTSYGELAAQIGKPNAARAVGGAVGANPIAWLIPCHRVIRSMGVIGDYRWGATRKLAMLGYESARSFSTK